MDLLPKLYRHSGLNWFGCKDCDTVMEQTCNSVSGAVQKVRDYFPGYKKYQAALKRLAKEEKSRLRLPVKDIKAGEYYFQTTHNDEQAKKPLDPTGFDLVRLTGKWPSYYLRYLNSLCLQLAETGGWCQASYDFYPATETEVAEAKNRQKELDHKRVEELIDKF